MMSSSRLCSANRWQHEAAPDESCSARRDTQTRDLLNRTPARIDVASRWPKCGAKTIAQRREPHEHATRFRTRQALSAEDYALAPTRLDQVVRNGHH